MAEMRDIADRQHVLSKLTIRYTHIDCDGNQLSAYRVDTSSTSSDFTVTPMFVNGYQTQSIAITDNTMPRYGAG